MPDPKVISLTANRTPSPMPPIVNSVRQQARRQLVALVRELFDGTDDALFEMADRSHSNSDHNLYFDSMRQIRLHRMEVERLFIAEINEGFERAFSGVTGGDAMRGADADDLDLVQSDELEVSVAISGIVSKTTSQFSLPIMELTRRFDHLARRGSINERRNPLGPQMVSEAFGRATDILPVDIKIRIILLKLFERTVMQRLGPIYERANRTLMDAGVLKDMRHALGHSRPVPARVARVAPERSDGSGRWTGLGGDSAQSGYASKSTGANRADSWSVGSQGGDGSAGTDPGGPAIPSGQGGFDIIQSLVARLRSGDHATGGGCRIETPTLLELLTAVQSEAGQRQVDAGELPQPLDLRQVVVSRARDVTGEALNHLGPADEDVVNFIGLLFDYILNDRNLAIPMKALISRLQIPLVKLAILDKSFFDHSGHPARQLLNELSSAGIGWSSAAELKRDALYDKIESIVVRILDGFRDNPGVFAELLEELRAFRARDTVRSARMEQRVRESESGRARTLLARQQVQKVINQKVCGLRLPREAGRFLSEVWSRVMVFVSFRDGIGAPAWETLMAALDDLLWALQPLDDLQQLDQRDAMRDGLLARLREGMSLIQQGRHDQEHWCRVIGAQLDTVSHNDRAFLEDAAVPRASASFPEQGEIVLAAPREVTDDFEGEAPTPDFLDEINRLTEGCWVEIQQESGALRCKLATIVKPGDRYVFVNRRGMKVVEQSRMALARELQDGRLTLLNESEVFERALQAVIGNLRQMHGQGA